MSKVNVETIFGTLDEAQIKTLKDGVSEMCLFMDRINSEKLNLKSVLDSIHEETKLPKKIINKLAKTEFKKSFVEETTEFNEFEALYEVLVSKE